VLASGNIVLSTTTLDGLTFGSGDLAEYNPGTNVATVFLDSAAFSGAENIDAAHVPEPSTGLFLGGRRSRD
jgi:hypothetical protein